MADDLIRRIATGDLPSGAALPSDVALASEYGIAPNTMRRALEHLAQMQLIERRKGKGTTVATTDPVERERRLISIVDRAGTRIHDEVEIRNVRVVAPSPETSRTLRQRSPRPVLRFDRLRRLEGRCYMIEDVHLPVRSEDLSGDAAALRQVADTLWRKREIAQIKRERLWGEEAGEEDAALLGIAIGQAVVCIERTLYGSRNMPLENRVARCSLGSDLFYVSD